MITPQAPMIVHLDDEFDAWTGTATPEIVSLIAGMFAAQGETRSAELLRWQYLSHLGGAHVCIAHTKAGLHAEPAALYAAFPTRFQVDGRAVTAYQSFDTLTAAGFRGRGLFVRLAELAYRQIADSGCGLVYGIPNGESFGGFVRRLGWSALDPLPMMIRPVGLRYLRSRARLRRPKVVSTAAVLEAAACPTDVTDLFRRSQYAGKSGVIRDHEYLQWRLQRPGSSYRLIESRGPRGVLNGIAVVDVLAKHGGTIGYLMELMIDPDALDGGRELLAEAINRMVLDGADVVLAWAMPDDPVHALLRHRGFRDLPARFSPIELHLGYRSFDEENTLDRGGLRWSYLDSDTV